MSDIFQDYFFWAVDEKVHYAMRMVHLGHLVLETAQRHSLEGGLATLLGEGLLGSVLLSSLLDDQERINLRIHCGTHFSLGTETTSQARTRGYIATTSDSPVVANIRAGIRPPLELHIRTLRSQRNKDRLFEGTTTLMTTNTEEALQDHLERSYQMNAWLRLSCWQHDDGSHRAFGWIHQLLPDAPFDVVTALHLHRKSLPTPAELFERNSDPDVLAHALMVPGTGLRGVKSLNPVFECTCSRERMRNALASLGDAELESLFEEQTAVEMKCDYCSSLYHFNRKDITKN